MSKIKKDVKGKTSFYILQSEAEVDRLIDACLKTGYCSHDFETTGEPVHSVDGLPTILGVSFQPGSAIILPLAHFDSPFKKNDKWLKLLRKFGKAVIENPNIIKICWNLKFEAQWWRKYGIEMKGMLFDAMLAKYALDEERPNDLKSMVKRYLPEFGGYEENYEGSKLPWDKKPLIGLSQYCAIDCDCTFRLMLFFERKLWDSNLYSLFRNMFMMASRVLTDSEYNGAQVNVPYLESLEVKYDKLVSEKDKDLRKVKQVRRIEKKLFEDKRDALIESINIEIEKLRKERKAAKKIRNKKVMAAKDKAIQTRYNKITRITAGEFTTKKEREMLEPFNFASTKQMNELLFLNKKGFRFPIIKYTEDKKTKKPTENPSSAEDVLIELKSKDKTGFISNLLDFRGLSQINNTFVKGIRSRLGSDNKIHTRFLIHGTVTGRLSSQDPNLQNLPRDTTASDIKQMFIPPKGHIFFAMDYSQAELRVLASIAKEETMLEWFRTGKDVHLMSALKKYKCVERYDEIMALLNKEDGSEEYITWKKRRKQAKTINFGIVYEQSAMKLSESLSEPEKGIIVTVEEAQTFLDDFQEDFPRIAKYIEKQHKLVKKQGYVTNLFGRKRRLPNIWSDSYREMLEAQRFSTNAPIQGTASDFALFSSILIWEKVKKGELPPMFQVFTVHDSLVFAIKPEHVHIAKPILDEICANPETKKWWGFELKGVKMKMDFECGSNYRELHKYDKDFDYTPWAA